MVSIALNGAAGRMGRILIGLVHSGPDCELVCALEKTGHPALGQDVGVLAGIGDTGVPLTEEMSGAPDVLVDFSFPEASVARALQCAEIGTAVVIGTTGLTHDHVRTLRQQVAARVPLLQAPNMSVGVNLLFSLVGQVAKVLGPDYDIEIIEFHHRLKKDAPSGTAAKLARLACEAMGWDPEEALCHGREGIVGERPRAQIGIHAVRGGDIVGDHTVLFASEGERIELTHRASSREVFARGALRAAKFLAGKEPGIYEMKDVLLA